VFAHRLPCTLLALFVLAGLIGGTGCRQPAPVELAETRTAAPSSTPSQPAPIFVDRAEETGLVFTHFAGISGRFFYSEMVGPGGALFDYDRDGDLDVYVVQGSMLPAGADPQESLFPWDGPGPPVDRLFRNELKETGKLGFRDVTESSGLSAAGYGMGVAIGDADGDGWLDIYVTNHGPNQLWRNRGDGSFEDVTESAGVGDPRWNTSAAFFDADRDGDLDLFVTGYVDYDIAHDKECFGPSSRRDYCGPLSFPSVPDRMYLNHGDGTFEDATARLGLAAAHGSALGVAVADYNGDGLLDLYVANDGRPNQLWIAGEDGRFRDEALLAGCAVNEEGAAEASMGVDAADFDGDGDEDLFMTHLTGETNTLYVNDGRGNFSDRSARSGVGEPSLSRTGFGTAWVDFDADGWLDLFVANGAVKTIEGQAQANEPLPLREPNQLLRNLGNGKFEDVSRQGGPGVLEAEVSRGAAFGDVDNDGDLDILLMNNSGPARLLINELADGLPWLGVRIVDETGERDLFDARVELRLSDSSSRWRRVRASGSYCSANDVRVVFGLAGAPAVSALRVHLPDGSIEEWPAPDTNTYTDLRRGTGRTLAP